MKENVFLTIRVIGAIIAIIPIVVSVWIFYENRLEIQNNEYSSEDITVEELSEDLVEDWSQVRSIGYLTQFLLFFVVTFLAIIGYILKFDYGILVTTILPDIILSIFILTFSFAIGNLFTSLYLFLQSLIT